MSNVPSHSRTRRSHRRTLDAGSVGSRRSHGFSDAYGAGEVSGAAEVYDQIAIDEAGQITAGGIAPGALHNPALFAQTIRPVVIVTSNPTLPDTNYPIGSFIYNITDSPARLYKNVANVWVAAIGPDDIQANSITAGQIAAGAVSTSELAVGARLTGEVANETGATPGVFIDSSGVLIRDGKLTLEDEFGQTTMEASGFSGAWNEYLATGLYNGQFRAGVAGTVGNGRTVALPYWTVSNDAGSPVLTFLDPGLRITFAALGNKKRIASDAVPVIGGRPYEVHLAGTFRNDAGTITIEAIVYWYKQDGSASATASTTAISLVYASPTTAAIGQGLGTNSEAVTAPTDAYFGVLVVTAAETGSHDVDNRVDLTFAMLRQGWRSTDLLDMDANGAHFPAGIIAEGSVQAAGGSIAISANSVEGPGHIVFSGSSPIDYDTRIVWTNPGEITIDDRTGLPADLIVLGEVYTEQGSTSAFTINNPGTATFANKLLEWVRIGRVVTFTLKFDVTATGSAAGTVTITGTGLPQAMHAPSTVVGARVGTTAQVHARAGNSGGELTFSQLFVIWGTGAITGTSLINGDSWIFWGSYLTA